MDWIFEDLEQPESHDLAGDDGYGRRPRPISHLQLEAHWKLITSCLLSNPSWMARTDSVIIANRDMMKQFF